MDWGRPKSRALHSLRWWLRQTATIALVHAAILVIVYFLFILADALFTSYALVLRDTVFVNYLTQASWLRGMVADVKGGMALVVAASALLQMLLLSWRVAFSR